MNKSPSPLLRDALRDLAWTQWSELGVSSWARGDNGSLIDPEALIVFTALIAKLDSRLAREAVDWCVSHDRFISSHQLRHLSKKYWWRNDIRLARFDATVAKCSGGSGRWFNGATVDPMRLSLSGKSRMPQLERPSLLRLRLRSVFGVNARAEILSALLGGDTMSIAELTHRVSYSRRQIEIDVDSLQAGGILIKDPTSSVARYRIRSLAAATEVFGRSPTERPPWAPTFAVLSGIFDTLVSLGRTSLDAPGIELQRLLDEREVRNAAKDAGLTMPMLRPAPTFADRLGDWTARTAIELTQLGTEA